MFVCSVPDDHVLASYGHTPGCIPAFVYFDVFGVCCHVHVLLRLSVLLLRLHGHVDVSYPRSHALFRSPHVFSGVLSFRGSRHFDWPRAIFAGPARDTFSRAPVIFYLYPSGFRGPRLESVCR